MNIDYSILHDLYLAGVKSKQVEEFGSKEASAWNFNTVLHEL